MADAFERLISALARLPGVGRRSAERMALRLVVKKAALLKDLKAALVEAEGSLVCCSVCGAITRSDADPCRICTDPDRSSRVLCVVEDPGDIMLIERAGVFRGRYHALMGKLSPMNGAGVAELRIEPLARRVREEGVEELLLALNSDVESDATGAFIRDRVGNPGLRISRLAHGLPVGSGVSYLDSITLGRAIEGRQVI